MDRTEVTEPPGRWDHVDGLALTELGLQWAASGFPEISMTGSAQVQLNLDIHVAVNTVIRQTRQSDDVDSETKFTLEALLRRIEEELEKPEGQGSFKPVREAMETQHCNILARSSRDVRCPQ